MIEVRAKEGEGRSFRWGPKDGFKRKVGEGIIALRRGYFVAFLSDWKAVDGEFGVQTCLTLEVEGFVCYLWLRGDFTEAIRAEGAGVWRFTSEPSADKDKFVVLRAERLPDDTPLDGGVLMTLFQDLDLPF